MAVGQKVDTKESPHPKTMIQSTCMLVGVYTEVICGSDDRYCTGSHHNVRCPSLSMSVWRRTWCQVPGRDRETHPIWRTDLIEMVLVQCQLCDVQIPRPYTDWICFSSLAHDTRSVVTQTHTHTETHSHAYTQTQLSIRKRILPCLKCQCLRRQSAE